MGDSGARTRSHYSDEQWLDYAREQAGTAREAMAAHLATGCARCAATLALWQSAVAYATPELAAAPPEGVVRAVRAQFAAAAPQRARANVSSLASLVFDSLRQPALAGVRASAAPARQLAYRAGDYLVRVTVEPAEAQRLTVVGQVLDEKTPGRPLRDVAVLALHGRRTVDRTFTNDLGEFEMEPEAADDLRLSVGVPGRAPVRVPLLARQRPAARPGALGSAGRRADTRRRPGRTGPRR